MKTAFFTSDPSQFDLVLADNFLGFVRFHSGDKKQALTETKETILNSHSILDKKSFYGPSPHYKLTQTIRNVSRRFRVMRRRKQLKEFPVVSIALVNFSPLSWWVSLIGELAAYHYASSELKRVILVEKPQLLGIVENIQTIFPKEVSKERTAGELLLICTPSLPQTLNEKKLGEILTELKDKSLDEIAKELVQKAQERRKQEKYAALLVQAE